MFNTFFIQTRQLTEVRNISRLPRKANVCLTHVIDLQNRVVVQELIAFYYSEETTFNFSLALINSGSADLAILNELMLLFAHPKYYRGQNGIQVFVFESGNETSVLNSVDAFLSGQGYSEKEVLPLPATIVQSDKPGTFLLENHSVSAQILTEDFQRFYKNYLTQTYKAQDFFFVQSGQEIAIEESLKTITETEADFKQDNPYLAELIGKLFSEKTQNKMLGFTAESQRQELAIMQELFLANAKNNEIQYILDFYHKEYEALPLWYKRFGHILKACMGKRSWRSLLQDEHA